MVVLNSFPRQTLKFEHPEVTIINLKERPSSLGVARNLAIGLVKDDDALIVTADDDDAATSWHLDNYGKNCDPDCSWVWLNQEFFLEGFKIKSVAQGTPNTFAFRKHCWREVGWYPDLTVGEDRSICTRITSQFKGKRVNLQPYEISFCRNWVLEFTTPAARATTSLIARPLMLALGNGPTRRLTWAGYQQGR